MNINSRQLPTLVSLVFICLLIMGTFFYGIIIAMKALIKNGITKISKYVLHLKVRII